MLIAAGELRDQRLGQALAGCILNTGLVAKLFDPPEADLGVHPTEGPEPKSGTADISFYCDDIHASVREMKARGVEFTMEVEDHGYGLVTHFKVPGGFDVQLYQPKYRK